MQTAWSGTIENARVRAEHAVQLGVFAGKPKRSGRIDIFVDQIEDFVTVVEIKSTNWDLIPPGNRRRLLSSHRRQVLRYVDEHIRDGIGVCASIIYPQPPKAIRLREEIEEYLSEYSLQVAWFDGG